MKNCSVQNFGPYCESILYILDYIPWNILDSVGGDYETCVSSMHLILKIETRRCKNSYRYTPCRTWKWCTRLHNQGNPHFINFSQGQRVHHHRGIGLSRVMQIVYLYMMVHFLFEKKLSSFCNEYFTLLKAIIDGFVVSVLLLYMFDTVNTFILLIREILQSVVNSASHE